MRQTNSMFRSSRSLVAIFVVSVVGAIVACSVDRARTTVNPVLIPTEFHSPPIKMSRPPVAIGCYYQEPGHEWQSVACVPSSKLSKQPRQQIKVGDRGATWYLTKSNGMSITPTAQDTSLTEGFVAVSFLQFSGEYDSATTDGFDVFSMQANSNTFTINGHTYWVQFTYTNNGPPSGNTSRSPIALEPAQLCVQQQDNDDVHQKCVPTPNQALSSNWFGVIQGISTPLAPCKIPTVYPGSKRPPPAPACQLEYFLTAVIWTPWGALAVTDSDLYGLSSHWGQFGGSILGGAMGSEACFTSPTLLNSLTGAYAQWIAPPLNATSATFATTGGTTAERNNLSFITTTTTTEYSGGWAFLNSQMNTNGQCNP